MNNNLSKELIYNGFCPQLIEHLDLFLNHCCWDFCNIYYIHGEAEFPIDEASHSFIKYKFNTIKQSLTDIGIKSSYTWLKNTNTSQDTKIQFIVAVEQPRMPSFDKIVLTIIQNVLSLYSPKIIDSHQGRVFGYSYGTPKITHETVELYTILTEKLRRIAWHYQPSSLAERNFGGSPIINQKRLKSLFPIYKQGQILVDALSAKISGEGEERRPWYLGEQMCMDFR